MIAGNEEKMINCLEELRETRTAIAEIAKRSDSRYQITEKTDITAAELKQVLLSRLAKLEAQAGDMGIYGPGAKDTAKAQAVASLHRTETNHDLR